MLPYTNATLTAIAPVGSSADYDQPASAGIPRWTGEAGIYVADEVKEIIGTSSASAAVADRIDEVVVTRVEIPYNIGRLVKRGDTITYIYEGQPVTRTAGTITHAPLVGRVRILPEDA